jgi:hypothetical protein
LEKKLYEEPVTKEDKRVIMLLSDSTMRNYNVAVMKSKPIMDLSNALYVFPYMVSEEKARKAFEKLKLN